jgi:hypothetical protein
VRRLIAPHLTTSAMMTFRHVATRRHRRATVAVAIVAQRNCHRRIVTAAAHIRSTAMHQGDAATTRDITASASIIAMSLTLATRVMSASVG